MNQVGYLILLFLSFNSSAQNNIPKAQLDKVILELVRQYKVPNFSVAITNSDSIIYNLSSETDGHNALYLIGSNTKSITSICILKLVDKGLIDLDKTVSDYLKWFSFGNETPTNKITVRNLLNQTSGLPTYGGFFEDRKSDLQTFELNFGAYLKKLSPAHPINESFTYCNANFVLLGLIIQHVTGRIYGDFVQDSIFTPLEMSNSLARFENGFTSNFVDGHQYAFLMPVKTQTEKFQFFQIAPGRIASSTDDMSHYLRAMLKGASGVGLTEASYQNLITPNKGNYAMGWYSRNYYGENVLQHLGENENFCSAMFLLAQHNLGVMALNNINSTELNSELEDAIVLTLQGKVYQKKISIEWILRVGLFLICLFLLILFVRQMIYFSELKIIFSLPTLNQSKSNFLRISLSVLPLIFAPTLNKITLTGMIQYAPDFAYGIIFIAVIGGMSGFIRMFFKGNAKGIV